MKKLAQHFLHSVRVPRVQLAGRHGVYRSVARVAKRDEVVERVVSALHIIAKPSAVDVVDMQPAVGGATRALEPVALEGGEVVSVPVLRDRLGEILAARGAIQFAGVRARRRFAAYFARERYAATRACFVSCAARVELLTAAIARLGVALGAAVLVSRLTWLAAKLKRVMKAKFGGAVAASANASRGSAHALNHTLIWGA